MYVFTLSSAVALRARQSLSVHTKKTAEKMAVLLWSERHDLNVRPLPPQGSALAKLSYAPKHFSYYITANGICQAFLAVF